MVMQIRPVFPDVRINEVCSKKIIKKNYGFHNTTSPNRIGFIVDFSTVEHILSKHQIQMRFRLAVDIELFDFPLCNAEVPHCFSKFKAFLMLFQV